MSNVEQDSEDEAPLLVNLAEDTQKVEKKYETLQNAKVPITIVTGYLGAGKTTLMNYILTEQHGKRIAVILNEFGNSADIEKALTVNKDGQQVEEWLELANGCLCCSAKDLGVIAIESLMERQGTFDYILLETSGLADPGNIAPMFWVDEGLGSSIYLDGIVTVVDAKNISQTLTESSNSTDIRLEGHDAALVPAHRQISHADVILVNKADLVAGEDLEKVILDLKGLNGLAKCCKTKFGQTPLEGVLLDLHAYDRVTAEDIALKKGNSHLDPRISSVCIDLPRLSEERLGLLELWLREVLWDSTLPKSKQIPGAQFDFEVHRAKGLLIMENGPPRILQGVRDVFEIFEQESTTLQQPASVRSKIILIGRNLTTAPWNDSVTHALNF
ncbi:MAG: hypothetical protein M1814_004695 [Vezdaea aestivalis]|nr:MAG: hypothetical protein M1814_004695 [Vezdaea aestivalis]